MARPVQLQDDAAVAPRAGAWIEMTVGRGIHYRKPVAPRAGAWIEILRHENVDAGFHRRSPCGSVD